ncbi:hypothetical protein BAZ12_18085 [Elizabethkingia miricola]|uniref:SprT-like domain-containing protein n=2 Tax=Weeksellaceae TaxID=2762318 RepID=A0ABD4DKK3_ELIMR|nr:hypothetical protein ATB95_12880 [Elizabethkingia miricola]OPC72193.1 hypothetical protein BAZ13_05660 [Elizabethkingia miricola]OPC75935.1 hypothetical protein BAZ12_18085 [Elizabethkingia miricola]
MLIFNGCRTNDEAIKNERQIQGAEYSSKTLWNEDEKYINNVIKIYNQNKETVSKSTQIKGEPFWDYAMTMGQFNESYLEVPIVNQEKVVQILRVIRKGSQVYFGSNSEEKASLDFFQQLIFGKYTTIKGEEERKGKVQNTGNGALADGQYICTTRKISMWYPDDNNNPDGSGHWETYYESRCLWVEQEKTDIIVPCVGPGCDGAGDPGGGTPGFPYPDEADKIDVEPLKDYPCAYAIAQELPNLNNELAAALKKIFKNSDKYNITFKPSDILKSTDPTDGITQGPKDPANYKGGVYNQTIFLNKYMLQNATKEYILATMYHEVVHAYLNSELNRLGQQQFEIEYPKIIIDHTSIVDAVGGQLIVNVFRYYPDHQEAAAYIDTLHDILISYNPNLSPKTASSLSKSGMVDLTPEEMEINSRERGIDKTLGQQKGTKCTN